MAKDVIVHGAGIVGIVTAYTALKAGHNVIIHEPHGLIA
jgi:glycine/D-amino acid oxidase-like deaminating enzyme